MDKKALAVQAEEEDLVEEGEPAEAAVQVLPTLLFAMLKKS
jgi:hypothetical protein